MPRNRTDLFVGIGSPHGDDQVGWHVAERLRGRLSSVDGILIRRAILPIDLVDWLDEIGHLHVCDACQSGAPPGSLHRWDWSAAGRMDADGPSPFDNFSLLRSTGTHNCGLGEVLCLARKLGCLPSRVTVWGVEAAQFEPNNPLSGQLQTAISQIVATILPEIAGQRSAMRPEQSQAQSFTPA
jgi:hydrogenase maturation protease